MIFGMADSSDDFGKPFRSKLYKKKKSSLRLLWESGSRMSRRQREDNKGGNHNNSSGSSALTSTQSTNSIRIVEDDEELNRKGTTSNIINIIDDLELSNDTAAADSFEDENVLHMMGILSGFESELNVHNHQALSNHSAI